MSAGKILVINAEKGFSFGNPNSAVANYLKMLIDRLKDSGFEVHTYPRIVQVEKPKQVVIGKGRLGFIKRIFRSYLPLVYNGILIGNYHKHAQLVSGEIQDLDGNYDLVIEFLTRCSTAGVTAKNKFKSPLMLIYDSPVVEQFREMHGGTLFNKELLVEPEKRSILYADGILCYSEAVKDFLQSSFGVSMPIACLPCIVWSGDLTDRTPENVIGFVGSFLKWHKVEVLVSAFEKIADEFPKVRLVLVGYGQEWDRINHQVSNSRVKDWISLTGFVSNEELQAWKTKFTIGVMPGSNWYGSPLKLFEYAEARIPMIAPATPTIKSLFTEDEVLFIDPRNEVNSLADHLRKLLSDPQFRQSLEQRSYNKMKTIYSKENQLSLFTDFVNKLFNNKNGVKR